MERWLLMIEDNNKDVNYQKVRNFLKHSQKEKCVIDTEEIVLKTGIERELVLNIMEKLSKRHEVARVS